MIPSTLRLLSARLDGLGNGLAAGTISAAAGSQIAHEVAAEAHAVALVLEERTPIRRAAKAVCGWTLTEPTLAMLPPERPSPAVGVVDDAPVKSRREA